MSRYNYSISQGSAALKSSYAITSIEQIRQFFSLEMRK